ncbi:hypothetical protein EDB84DRAFT_1563144 [Lactarius hengduanensis]|nr:hypothetical protein EDB84DRAFT_1563144 [Lactarius hengduanensis]
MSSTTSDLGQAVRPDGTLKDASEIVWTYDVDESTPFPLDNVTGTHPFFSGGRAPATMVAGARRTARVPRPSQRARDAAEATAEATTSSSSASAGARVPHPSQRARDAAEATTSSSLASAGARVPHPSQRARDAAEATTSSSSASTGPGAKCKAPTATVPRRVMCKVDLDDSFADHSDDGATTEPNTEPASDDYESIKAMADADKEATTFTSERPRAIADILLIFRYQDDYVHPDTAKVLKGYCAPHSRAALATQARRVPNLSGHIYKVSRRAKACATVSDCSRPTDRTSSPNLAALARGSSPSTVTRPRPPQTRIRPLAPRGGLRDTSRRFTPPRPCATLTVS